ncbi:MAG: recombinase [Sphingopyxis sp.]|nr:recombinase [Sphingopyxis sp.]
MSDEQMLAELRSLYENRGLLSGLIIDESDALPSSSAYSSRFGSLLRAYSLVGFRPDRDYRYIEINRSLRRLHPAVLHQILEGLRSLGSEVEGHPSDKVTVNGEFSLSVVIVRCDPTPTGLLRWKLRFDTSLSPDITIVVRMDQCNQAPLDYYLFPHLDLAAERLRLAEDNGLGLDAYRFENLDYFYEIAAPVRFAMAA